ncbi:MAG: hypothetical protein ACMUIM_10240 [bacterium]
MGSGKMIRILSVLIILSVIILSGGMVSAQYPFYTPFYYPSSFLTFPFFPTYNPVFPFYNTTSIFPFYNTFNFNPSPLPATAYTAPAIAPTPTASISAVTGLVPFAPVTTILGVIIADFIINTGNPQVTAVLNLIAQDPTLLDTPWLLDLYINTGNPDVASALLWLVTAI